MKFPSFFEAITLGSFFFQLVKPLLSISKLILSDRELINF
ncbi:hypothetical protein HMPREF1881_01479 [Streptococcus agalactiae]|nr:hypothetical protein HMPREF1881_01479 [Streptococcus agalactiae]